MYSEKVMDHFQHPRNMGEIEDASGVGTVGNAKCGDIMRIYLDIDDETHIIRVDSGRTYEKLTSFRDAGSDLPDPEIHGRARFQCGGHGKRRADGQL